MLKFNKEITELEALSTEDTKIGDIFELTFNSLDESLWITKTKSYKGNIKGIEFKSFSEFGCQTIS
jgi:hypothetical protein